MADASPLLNRMTGNQDEESMQYDVANDIDGAYQAGHHWPETTVGATSSQIEDDIYGVTDTEDEPMDPESRSSGDEPVAKITFSNRNLGTATISASLGGIPAGDGENICNSRLVSHCQGDNLIGSPSEDHALGDGPNVQRLERFPIEATLQIHSPQKLAGEHIGLGLRLSGLGGMPTTDAVLYGRASDQIEANKATDPAIKQMQSPFSRNVSSVPGMFAVTPTAFPSPLAPSVQATPAGDTADSQPKTTAFSGPITPQPQPQPTDSSRTQTSVMRNIPPSSMQSHTAPSSAAPFFSYSVDYIDNLRNHIIDRVIESYLGSIFDAEICDDILRMVRRRDWRLGSAGQLAQQAGLAPQDAYFGDAAEQMMSVWFDVCVVDEAFEEFEEFLPMGLDKEKERTRFMEEHVRGYLRKHPADC